MTSITVRPAQQTDLAAIQALNTLAFGGPEESRIVESLLFDGDDLLSLVAVADNDAIVGHIQFFPIDVRGNEPGQFAGLGPMCVHPDHQKSGIGGNLIRSGLTQLKTRGIQKVFVLGHPEYYPKFGFSVDHTAGFAAAWGGPAFMAIELNSGGPDFGELVYPQAFSED